MATRTLTLLSRKTYSDATFSWGPVAPNQAINAAQFFVEDPGDTFTDPAQQLVFDVQESFDGGVTWQDLGGFTAVGTTALNKQGMHALPAVTFTFSPPADSSHQFQGALRVIGSINFDFKLAVS